MHQQQLLLQQGKQRGFSDKASLPLSTTLAAEPFLRHDLETSCFSALTSTRTSRSAAPTFTSSSCTERHARHSDPAAGRSLDRSRYLLTKDGARSGAEKFQNFRELTSLWPEFGTYSLPITRATYARRADDGSRCNKTSLATNARAPTLRFPAPNATPFTSTDKPAPPLLPSTVTVE